MTMADFSIESTKTDTFPEKFRVAHSGDPISDEEHDYIQELEKLVSYFDELPVQEISTLPPADAALVTAKIPLRKNIMQALYADADKFCGKELSAKDAVRRLIFQKGRYEAERSKLEANLFLVREKIERRSGPTKNGISAIGNSNSELQIAVDLEIVVRSGRADPTIPPRKHDLHIALDSALTVIKKCCDRIRSKNKTQADILLDEFIRKLAGIGRVGLEGDHPELAIAALDSLKREFFVRKANSIKQQASLSLGIWALAVSFLLTAMYFVARWFTPSISGFLGSSLSNPAEGFFWIRKEFFLMGSGAAIGTWLSFSIRSLNLSFDDLGTIEDELLGPLFRISFVISLTMVLGLVFWTQAFSISIGEMKVMPPIRGATALLVGVFCGLSERALATAMSSRAAAFVKGISSA